MKKLVGLFVSLLLVGCETTDTNSLNVPRDMKHLHTVERAPWPWVQVVPSERALKYQGFNFPDLKRHVLYELAGTYTFGKFKKVRLVLVDYTVLPAKPSSTKLMRPSVEGQNYYDKFTALPERYYMNIQLFECDQRPPAKPSFKGSAFIATDMAAPMEAMHILLREIVENMIVYKEDGIVANLD